MLKQKVKNSALVVTDRVSGVVRYLVRDEAASGKFLLLAAVIALAWANSSFSDTYENFWHQHLSLRIGGFVIDESFRGFINEGLMAVFFLVVGLEIKREMVLGELRKFRTASLPIAAAIGGMLFPAMLYMLINNGHAGFSGWGIPMATDIAFAIGILALISRRIPSALKLFLLTLAVVDDIGAVIVIAIFYTAGLEVVPLFFALMTVLATILFGRRYSLPLPLFILLGIIVWSLIYVSGVHASIAGAVLGLIAPVAAQRIPPRGAIGERLEKALIPISTFLVIPLFALANAGVAFNFGAYKENDLLLVGLGIGLGLVLGKIVGIVGAAWIMVRIGLSSLPKGATWHHIAGAGFLAGIGFTLSLFVTELSFDSAAFLDAAKMSILIASLVSAVLGLGYLTLIASRARGKESKH